MLVGRLPNEKHTAWHKKNIAKHRRAERPTGKRRKGEECKIRKKPWLMHLQHPLLCMIYSLKMSRLASLAAIFAARKVWLWSISHGGAMGDGNQRPVSRYFVILEELMVNKNPLVCHRIRKIEGSFAWISHRFLRSGFFAGLTRNELLLYFFLVLVADRQGLSYYHYDKICSLLRFSVEDYIVARDQLIEKDLIAFNGTFFQVLSLPPIPITQPARLLKTRDDMAASDPATIGQIIRRQLNCDHES
jgi:hypothetical protein